MSMMITNILLGLILLALMGVGFMVYVIGRMIDERSKN
mgnify:CR=1 FL=1|jgi:hypothetical protein|tara:strand:+ start:2006 stop:2119 length:114 start_codon:yes stop_codon:yes gene_type:complete